MQRFLVPIFTLAWWNRLRDREDPYHGVSTVIKVVGWRRALIDSPGGQRSTTTFCFGRFN